MWLSFKVLFLITTVTGRGFGCSFGYGSNGAQLYPELKLTSGNYGQMPTYYQQPNMFQNNYYPGYPGHKPVYMKDYRKFGSRLPTNYQQPNVVQSNYYPGYPGCKPVYVKDSRMFGSRLPTNYQHPNVVQSNYYPGYPGYKPVYVTDSRMFGSRLPTNYQQPNVVQSNYYPGYPGHKPVYVKDYQKLGSRFFKLLTHGVELYKNHSHHNSSEEQYSSAPGEICKLGISNRTGEYEETRIDCNLMSSFIWEDMSSTTRHTTAVEVTDTVNRTGNSPATTVSPTSNTVEDAPKVKESSTVVTPGMTCYLIRMFRDTTAIRKPVDCGLWQKYEAHYIEVMHNV